MKNHKFTYTGLKNNKKTYKVKCLNTTGEFNTALWYFGKVKNQICPCCNKEIKRK